MALRNQAALAMLLRIRKRQEDIQAQSFARARRSLNHLREERQSIDEEQRRLLGEAAAVIRDAFDPSEARRYYQYERYLARLGDEKDAEIQAQRRSTEAERRLLSETMKQRRMVEILDEHNRAAWDAVHRKREQQQIDEIALSYGRLAQAAYGGSETHTRNKEGKKS